MNSYPDEVKIHFHDKLRPHRGRCSQKFDKPHNSVTENKAANSKACNRFVSKFIKKVNVCH